MPRLKNNVLFFPHYNEPLKTTLLPIANQLKKEFHYDPIFVLRTNDPLSKNLLDASGHRYVILPKPIRNYVDFKESIRIYNIPKTFIRIIGFVKFVISASREADRLIREYKPKAIVQVMESSSIEPFINKKAAQKSIKSILVQWAQTFPQKKLAIGSNQSRKERYGYGNSLLLESFYLLRKKTTRMFFNISLGTIGIPFNKPLGEGNAAIFAVTNNYYAHLFTNQGVPKNKIVVTGHPEDDIIHEQLRTSRLSTFKSQALSNLGLDSDKKVVIYVRDATQQFNLLTPEEDKYVMRQVLNTINNNQTHQSIIKLHPRDNPRDYEWIKEEFPRIKIIHECDLYELISISDVYVGQISSTIRWAVLMGKKVILVALKDIPTSEDVANQFSLSLCRSPEELWDTFRKAILDDSTCDEERLSANNNLDGKAISRIIRSTGLV